MHPRKPVDLGPKRLRGSDELAEIFGPEVGVVASRSALRIVAGSGIDLGLGYALPLVPGMNRVPQRVR